MLMRWSMLMEMLSEILVLYCAMAFGRRVKSDDGLHRVYRWRGKEYAV